MFRPVPLKKILICLLYRDADRVTELLGRLHVLHLTRLPQDEVSLPVEPVDVEEELQGCRRLLELARNLAYRLHVPLPENVEAVSTAARDGKEPPDMNMVEGLINRIQYENRQLFTRSDKVKSEIERTSEIIAEIEPYVQLDVPLEQLDKFSFLHFAIGTVPEANLAELEAEVMPSTVILPLGQLQKEGEVRRSIIAITNKTGRWALETALMENGFEPAEREGALEGIPHEVHRRMLARRDDLERERKALQEELLRVTENYSDLLVEACERLLIEEQVLMAKANFGRTGSTIVISGWVPAGRADEVAQQVLQLTEQRAIIEFHDDKEQLKKGEQVPVLTANPRWLKPFEQLVRAYGHPRYGEIEPTLFAMVTFLVMFGLMFGDLGHGLMLVVAGLLIRKYCKAPQTCDFGSIVAWAGAAAALFGTFFQGSVFGLNLHELGWTLSLNMEPLGNGGRNVTPYLAITIGVGVIIITGGLILNVINRLRTGDLEHGFMDRFGVAGFVFYWGAIGLGIKLTLYGSGRYDMWLVVFLIILPLLLICFREPIFSLLTRRPKLWREGAGMGIITGLIETYETVSAYLANTMSFARVGAFALSHAGLLFTIYEFKKVVSDLPGRTVLSALVVVGGHLFVIALEGFIVFIQIVRLEYYEFFGKFFRADGKAFRTFKVGSAVEGEPARKV